MKFILGVVAGIVLIPVLVFAYLASGFGPAAATDKPLPFENWIANTALRSKMRKEAPAPRDLSSLTTADLLAGADTYKKDCAVCHGLPDQPAAAIGQGMFPPAPQLMRAPPGRGPGPGQNGPPSQAAQGGAPGPGRPGGPGRGSGNDFWRIKNGIRLTGMPSFEGSLTDDQIWQLVGLLERRRFMPPDIRAELLSEPPLTIAPPASITKP
jgi:thiosulfate dehydrogenase